MFSYDPELDTDKDWVRFLTGDRVESRYRLEDEEILALLTEEQNKYLAAARAGEILLGRSDGIIEKWVDGLRIKKGSSAEQTYRDHLKSLRERGAGMTFDSPSIFRVL